MITMFIQNVAASEVIDHEILSWPLDLGLQVTQQVPHCCALKFESLVQSKLNFKHY